ncbi:MAG TPA: PDZ domain-containing protein [Kofleriaceae bacterium]
MPETHQALLYDKTAGTHVLVELGKTLDGYTVQDIDEDEVTLEADSGTEIVLAAPEWRHREDRDDRDDRGDRVAAAKPAVKPAAAAPQDPYAAPGPQDPYAQPAVRVVEAPAAAPATPGAPAPVPTVSAAPAPTTTVATAAPAPTTATTAPAAAPMAAPAVIISIPPSATPPAPAAVVAPAPAAVVAPAPAAVVVAPAPVAVAVAAPPAPAANSAAWSSTPAVAPAPSPMLARADVNAALSNFAKLAGSVHGSFTADGARLDSIATDSLFAKIGLRAGDVIASVDGQPLRSLDDAATLYARAPGMKAVTLAVVRAGKPLSLRVVIQ